MSRLELHRDEMIGAIKEFNEKEKCWCCYFKIFVNLATLNSLYEKAQIRALIVMGVKRIFSTLKAQLNGVDPYQIEISLANELLSAHFNPKPLVLSEGYKFWTASQKEYEALNDYSLQIQAINFRKCAKEDPRINSSMVASENYTPLIVTDVCVNDFPIKMEVNTGSS
ncbi:hypothetical protein HZS_5463, partial [Henneguya salminicola]